LTLDNFSEVQKTSIYPNPVSNLLSIRSDEAIFFIINADVLGAVI